MKRSIVIFLCLTVLISLVSCSSGKSPSDDPDTDPSKSEADKNGGDSELLKYLETNSALPCLPGSYLDSVDTDGFVLTEDSSLIIYSSPAFGMTYCFERAENTDGSRLIYLTFTSVRYAILGITVGDSVDDAKTVFGASGFTCTEKDSTLTFSQGSVKVVMESSDKRITSITVEG